MKIWNPYHIYFFRHLLRPDLYFIRIFHEGEVEDYYNKVRDTNPDKKHRYEFLEVEPPFVPIEMENGVTDKFLGFIKEKYFKKIIDENPDIAYWLGGCGWFEIDTIDPDKWLNDFHDFQKQKQLQKEPRNTNVDAIQTSLF